MPNIFQRVLAHFERPAPAALALTSDHGVSRARRAIFAFIVTVFGMAMIAGTSFFKLPVSSDIVINAQHVLGDISTFIGVAYISGSVVDYRSMMNNLAGKYGINIPMLAPPATPPAADAPDSSSDQ